MSRGLRLLALLAALLPAAPAAAQDDAHRHAGLVFRIRHAPELNRELVYRAFLTDPDNPASLIVERGHGWSGNSRQTDLRPAACPALRRAVTALADLPLPAVFLGAPGPYDIRAPRGEQYVFHGFARFPNGGEGEVSFMAYDVPGRPRDAHLEWMRSVVLAFEGCAGRGG